MKKRVVITGLGAVSCFGQDVEAFYNSLLEGKSGVEEISHFPCDEYPTRIAACVKNFDPEGYIDKKQARRIDSFISYALVAGKKAVEDAAFDVDKLNKTRCGVIVGSGMGGMSVFSNGMQTLLEKGVRRISPFFVPFIITNMAGALLAIDVGFQGPNYSISTACATGTHSIIAAANHIRHGEADLMVCGGAEGAVLPISLAGFCQCKALSQRNDEPTKASRPWDRGRDGFVMGEGAGVLVLESLEHAQKRNATIYAEYLGGGTSCDAYHMTDPHPNGDGAALGVQIALKDAGVGPEEINYVNAHGTSTPVGDMAEVNALKKVFKEPGRVLMNSTKSMIGHSLGAAGGLEAVTTVKTIETGMAHPTINLDDPEPDLDFHVPAKATPITVQAALSNSFGFGGHNGTIVFGPFKF